MRRIKLALWLYIIAWFYHTAALPQIYLLSLQGNNAQHGCVSNVNRHVWKWKDRALGDGQDFFIPRPRTIRKLQDALLLPYHQSCTILSNCARFEIMLLVDDKEPPPTLRISEHLIHQVHFYKEKYGQWSVPFDFPASITLDPIQSSSSYREEAEELAKHFTIIQGVEEITRHMCLVSTGLASRPARPDRPVIFRPYSSRDAHILLQLKRTHELIAKPTVLATIFELALQAGKMARTESVVEEIRLLRPFGTGNSKYDAEPPRELLQQVTDAVHEKVIEPTVQKALLKFDARNNSDRIARFRNRAEALAENASELAQVRREMHEATMTLRRDGTIVEDEEMLRIQTLLEKGRKG